MHDYILWDATCDYDLHLSQQINISWFPNSEIISDRHLPEKFFNDTRKKVVLVDYAFGMLPHDWKYHDLSWVDLVVCLNTEMTNLNFNDSYNKATKDFNNKNVIFILSGIRLEDQSNCIPDRFYFPYLSFFHRVICANDQISVEYNSARLFGIEALIGSKKYNRVFVFNKLKEFDLLETSLVSLVSLPHEAGNPDQIDDYESSAIENLDDPCVIQFKKDAKDPYERYSFNQVKNRHYKDSHYNVSMSQIIPVNVYKESWYSIVCETSVQTDLFLTEKTAKPLLAKRIFVSFSFPGHLKFLHSLGFRTFGDIIDESYDDEIDLDSRLNKAWDQVLYLLKQDPNKMYAAVKDVLEHNKTTMQCILQKDFHQVQSFIKNHMDKL
jgi:hypothetical protein